MAKASQSAQDALELLAEDHERVLQLFSAFEQLQNDEEDDDSKRDLVDLACAELTVHAQLEEELFYPALRDALDEQDLIDEAEVEHDVAKQLIAELEAMEPDEEMYDARFTVLSEYVRHHIEEEENEIFPKAKEANIDLEALAADMLERREELMAEYGLVEDDDEDEDETYLPAPDDDSSERQPRA